jgi:hypothetical protein
MGQIIEKSSTPVDREGVSRVVNSLVKRKNPFVKLYKDKCRLYAFNALRESDDLALFPTRKVFECQQRLAQKLLEIKTSTIPNANLGAFATTNLESGFALGFYSGKVSKSLFFLKLDFFKCYSIQKKITCQTFIIHNTHFQ